MFLVRAAEVNTIPKEHYGDSLRGSGSNTQSSDCRPNEMFVANA